MFVSTPVEIELFGPKLPLMPVMMTVVQFGVVQYNVVAFPEFIGLGFAVKEFIEQAATLVVWKE